MSDQKKKVLVVEDHPMFRERLAALLDGEPDLELAGEADTVEDSLRLIREVSPDLLLVDVTLKGSSGLALIKALKAAGSGIPILVLSMHDESIYAERAIRAGARGYITKHRAAGDVLRAIRTVLAGEVYLSEKATAEFLRGLVAPGTPGASRPLGRLTDRELEVLRLIGRGSTTREIAQTLGLGIASIDTYKARIKEKMNLRNATELQNFAIRWISERE
jgi:DNA-binding NarL/FixJ family response regulator